MKYKLFEDFCNKNDIKYKRNECLREHTTFKIGGPADFFLNVKNADELSQVIFELNKLEIPYFVIGKGSNLLVSDEGIEGAVISLSEMDEISVEGDVIVADAGVSLAAVCIAAANNSLSGLEFAYGIPASVGGALYMNAGAYGGEMSDVVKEAEFVSCEGKISAIAIDEMQLGYRTSIFKSGGRIITKVVFKLKSGKREEIRASMDDFLNRRRTKQPLEYPSAGSTFKRPVGYFAGALIENNNLKGKQIGGAMVSEKHAGFIINFDNATCDDVEKLIAYVSDVVYNADSVRLEPEVIFVGRK